MITALATALLLGVVGCGSQTPGSGANPEQSKTEKAQEPKKVEGPIEFRVTGGEAGVDHKVVLELDGTVTLDDGGGEQHTCAVSDDTLSFISNEAQTVADKQAAAQAPRGKSDGPNVTVSDPDAFNYVLTFADTTYRVNGGQEVPKDIRPMVGAMSDVLRAAQADAAGEEAPEGSPGCTA